MDERPDLLSHSSQPSCLLPSLFYQEPSSNCCCSMDTRACSRRLTTPPSKSLRSKVLLHVVVPFREEGTHSIDHTRRISLVRVHCSSSSPHRSVQLGEPLSNSYCTPSKHHSCYLLDIIVPPSFGVGRVDAIRRMDRSSFAYFQGFCSV